MVSRAIMRKPVNGSGSLTSRTVAPALASAAAAPSTAALVSGCAVSHISVRHNPIRGAEFIVRGGCGACMLSTAVSSSISSSERASQPMVSMLSAAGFTPALLNVL